MHSTNASGEDVSVYVSNAGSVAGLVSPSTPPAASAEAREPGLVDRLRRPLSRYVITIATVLVAHVIVQLTWQWTGQAVYTVFLGAVVIGGLYGGRGPGLLAVLLASLDLGFTFMPPYNSLAVEVDGALYLTTFLAVALLTSSLQARRRQAEDSLRVARDDLERRVQERTAELIQSQEQVSVLVNGVRDQAFFMVDLRGNVASWNAGAQRLLGHEAAEVIGKPLSTLWPACDVAAFAGDPDADGNERQDWVVHRGGARFWANILVTPLHEPAGRPLGFALSVRDVTERKGLERDLLEISERERERIGRDLHDGLGQELTGIALLSTALSEQLTAAGSTGGAADAEQIADLAHESIRHTRELAHGLCPVGLEDEGLVTSLRQLADRLARVPRLRCICDLPDAVKVDHATAAHLYRIAQEAVSNAIRHGQAKTITLRMRDDADGRLTLAIIDDGVGIPVGERRRAGMGMRLMSYRAKAIRGTLDVRPATPDGAGTAVICTLDALAGVSAHG